jgi:hypothetical protein
MRNEVWKRGRCRASIPKGRLQQGRLGSILALETTESNATLATFKLPTMIPDISIGFCAKRSRVQILGGKDSETRWRIKVWRW